LWGSSSTTGRRDELSHDALAVASDRVEAIGDDCVATRPARDPVGAAPSADKAGGGDPTSDDVRELRARAGDRAFTIAVGGRARNEDWEAEREHVRAVSEAGADWWVEWVAPADRPRMEAAVERGPLRI
jgi:hypothetical protein